MMHSSYILYSFRYLPGFLIYMSSTPLPFLSLTIREDVPSDSNQLSNENTPTHNPIAEKSRSSSAIVTQEDIAKMRRMLLDAHITDSCLKILEDNAQCDAPITPMDSSDPAANALG